MTTTTNDLSLIYCHGSHSNKTCLPTFPPVTRKAHKTITFLYPVWLHCFDITT